MVTVVKSIDAIIKEVNGTMAIEGMPLTDEDKSRIRACLRNNEKFNSAIVELLAKHTLPVVVDHA